jgi:hypothetical protein
MNDEKRRKELFARAFALLDRADALLLAARADHERDSANLEMERAA